MKNVKLAAPAAVNTGHPTKGFAELRYPIEGVLLVHDDEAQRLKDAGQLDGDPEDVAKPAVAEDKGEEPDDLAPLTVAELKAKALKDGVPLNDATRRADVIAAFVAHRASAA